MNARQTQPRAVLLGAAHFELKPTVSRSKVRGTPRHGADK
jgi:hypothetical protein